MTTQDTIQIGKSVAQLLEMSRTGNGTSVEAAILDLNTRFSTAPKGGKNPFRLWGLARQLDCYLVAIDMPDRKGKGRGVIRHWQRVVDDMAMLRVAIGGAFPFSDGLADYDLQGLTTYSTRKSGKAPFLASVTLYLINAVETDPETALAMQSLLPTSEQNMLAEIVEAWLGPLERGEPATVVSDEEGGESPATARVDVCFPYEETFLEDFERFFKKFAIQHDGYAHFICYRNGSTSPDRLLRSFLAIKPPKASEPAYTFAHYYEVPALGEQSRVSRGHVVPLESGVYLIGDHRPLADEVRTEPALSMEIIAFPWEDVKVPESLFRALTLTSNYKGEPIVSRMAVRATPVREYEALTTPLDTVEVDKLLAALESDIANEKSTGQDPFTRMAAEVQSERILTYTNNISRWKPSLTFRPIGQTGEKALDVQQVLDDTFGTEEDPRYCADEVDDSTFVFWQDLRFGPLSQE